MDGLRTMMLAAGSLVVTSGVALAECSPETWQDCAGKPWVTGDVMDTPLGSKWWPNELWGEGDEAGSTNWYTQPEVVKRGLAEATEGKVYRLGHDYTAEMPMFGARKWALRIPGTPNGGPFGGNSIVWNDDYLSTEIGQVGTQFDGLGHIGVQVGENGDQSQMYFYNGFTEAEMANPYGLLKLGTEKLHPIVARGVLIDLAGGQDVDVIEAGTCASMDDVNASLDKQGMADFAFQPGDYILFRYGWEAHWDDAETYNSGSPGICAETANWVAEIQAGGTGGDTWNATDPVPYPGEEGCAFCIHQMLQTRHGIVNQENLALTQLVDDGVYVFTYIHSPAPIAGATGSIGSPIAIK